MPADPDQTPPRRRSGRQGRSLVLWGAFMLAAGAALLAVYRLHQTVQREVAEQTQLALRQRQAEVRERIRTETEALRMATWKALVSFHVEGLTHALRQWDEATPAVVGTFQWDETSGLTVISSSPKMADADAAEIAGLWREFRGWRAEHPQAVKSEPTTSGGYRVAAVRTLENPLFEAGELGYQGENLEMLAYAGRPVDPWAGWAGHRRETARPWVFWYQPGPGAPVRGCWVDVGALVAQFRIDIADTQLARIELAAKGEGGELAAWLPGYDLTATPGDVFVEKQGSARLTALAAVLLLGLFLIGAAFLVRFSRREALEAERKTTFVTQVSHELRTPLTSIRMFADMLAAPELAPEKRARFSATISRESERLSALIERLLTFNALENSSAPAALAPVDAAMMVRETLEEMDATLRLAAMRVEADLPADAVMVTTDCAALKQALINLLENALKYARTGKVVRVALANAPDAVRLRVADEGPGIPRALGERVFEPFVQGNQTLVDKSPGVGLGLSIARGLLRRAGGDLRLLPSSTGALFEISLPHLS